MGCCFKIPQKLYLLNCISYIPKNTLKFSPDIFYRKYQDDYGISKYILYVKPKTLFTLPDDISFLGIRNIIEYQEPDVIFQLIKDLNDNIFIILILETIISCEKKIFHSVINVPNRIVKDYDIGKSLYLIMIKEYRNITGSNIITPYSVKPKKLKIGMCYLVMS